MPVRTLTAEDVIGYRVLRLEALEESPNSFGSAVEEERGKPTTHFADALAGSASRVYFGLFEGEKLVGSVGIEREEGLKERHRAFVRGMYVRPMNRGAGNGRALLQAALRHAYQWDGVEQVTLAVTASAEPALRLYQSAGFVQYGCAPMALRVGGVYHDELLFVRLRSAV